MNKPVTLTRYDSIYMILSLKRYAMGHSDPVVRDIGEFLSNAEKYANLHVKFVLNERYIERGENSIGGLYRNVKVVTSDGSDWLADVEVFYQPDDNRSQITHSWINYQILTRGCKRRGFWKNVLDYFKRFSDMRRVKFMKLYKELVEETLTGNRLQDSQESEGMALYAGRML